MATTIMHTTRTLEDGRTVYAVLCGPSPLCADTGDKAGTLALALRSFNVTRPPAKLVKWNADTGETITVEEK